MDPIDKLKQDLDMYVGDDPYSIFHTFYRQDIKRIVDSVEGWEKGIFISKNATIKTTTPDRDLMVTITTEVDNLNKLYIRTIKGKKSNIKLTITDIDPVDYICVYSGSALIKSELEDIYEYSTSETDGADPKMWVNINEDRYLLKLPKNKSLSQYSEYISSKFMNNIGLPSHETILSTYQGRICCLCKNLVPDGFSLRTFKEIHESSVDTDLSVKEYTYEDVLKIISSLKVDEHFEKLLIQFFWRQFVCDAILANRDRHHGNWGYLKDVNDHYLLASVYDNGASLFPNRDISSSIFDNYDGYVKIAPASVFKEWRPDILDRPMKTNFYTMFSESSNLMGYPEFKEAISWIRSKDINKAIHEAVDNYYIPDSVKQFSIDLVNERFKVIVERR